MKTRWRMELAGCFLAVIVTLVSAPVWGAEGEPSEPSPNWGEAGREIKEAAKAVGEATRETWQLAKEKGAEAWRETKETTSDAVRKTKKKIHDATAPKNAQKETESEAQPEDSAPPPAPGSEDAEGVAKEPDATQGPQMTDPAPQENNGSGEAGKRAI